MSLPAPHPRFRAITRRDLGSLPQLATLPADMRLAMRAVSAVLPFRVNDHVVDSLVDWSRAPDDPMFRLAFPQEEMLEPDDFATMRDLVATDAPETDVAAAADAIRARLNPHPAGQVELNVPVLGAEPLRGIQHKYRETVLFFPSAGQTCHTYCGYCFRWPQFVGDADMRFAARDVAGLVPYLQAHPDVTNVLFTGGDPLVMKSAVLERYLEPLITADLPNLSTVRIGTKSTAWWPQRFVTDPDADDLLRLFERVVRSGRSLALMAHSSHPRELEHPMAQAALRRIRSTGAVIRCQAPLIRHVNDDARTWADLWRLQVQLGLVPYYMFVERDTGPRSYYEVPLARAADIFREAFGQVSGLARTVRGPSMSATPGKVVVDGTATIGGEDVFVLRFLQARDPDWVGRPFFARLDPTATWLDQLRPAFGERRFFFEEPMREVARPDFGWRGGALARRRLTVFTEGPWDGEGRRAS